MNKQETLEEGISDYDITSNIRYGDNVGERIKIKATIKSIESKKETLTYTEAAKKEERIFNSTMMSKQETLEEATKERLIKHNLPVDEDFGEGYIIGSIFGAKWQQEQDKNKYSEEEVEIIIQELMNDVHCGDLCYGDNVIDFKLSPRQWFEKFKNK
jgi:hypothetical protein